MAKRSPLESAWLAHSTTRDCFRIADRALRHGPRNLLRDTTFGGRTRRRTAALILEARQKADEFIVVALWAEFERFLITFLQRNAASAGRGRPPQFSEAFRNHLREKIEYGRIDEILDVFKTIVTPERIGQVKQVKQFRDWIVHRNPSKGSPSKADPQTTHTLLSQVIAEIRSI